MLPKKKDNEMELKCTTIEYQVWNYNRMYKTRIETSLKVNGITKVKWNRETNILTAILNPENVSLKQIQASFYMTTK